MTRQTLSTGPQPIAPSSTWMPSMVTSAIFSSCLQQLLVVSQRYVNVFSFLALFFLAHPFLAWTWQTIRRSLQLSCTHAFFPVLPKYGFHGGKKNALPALLSWSECTFLGKFHAGCLVSFSYWLMYPSGNILCNHTATSKHRMGELWSYKKAWKLP